MLAAGDRIPDVTLRTPSRAELRSEELHARGPALLVFYLFDFSST